MSEYSFVERPESLAFDSTQTLRALSPSEMRDPNQQKWFVVQLAVSDRPVNLETMPSLDVFVAHRLYAVEGRSGSSTRYCLRLGFFKEEQSAQAICGYLKTFFRSPSVVRVSAAERARFELAGQPEEPSQTAAPTSSKVVALDSVRAGIRTNVKNVVNTTATNSAVAAADSRSVPQSWLPDLERPAQPQKTAGSSRQVGKKNKSLAQELLEEARQIELSKSGRYRVAKQTTSWLSRLLGGSKS
jgi:hypothetical protein